MESDWGSINREIEGEIEGQGSIQLDVDVVGSYLDETMRSRDRGATSLESNAGLLEIPQSPSSTLKYSPTTGRIKKKTMLEQSWHNFFSG